MDKKLRETSNLCVEIMNSKRQVKKKLGHVVQICVCRLKLTWCLSSLTAFILMLTRWDFFHRFKDSHRNDLTLQLKSPRNSIRILKQMNSCPPDLTYCPSARLRCESQVNSTKKDSARNKNLNIFHAAFSLLALTTLSRSGFFCFFSVSNRRTFHNFFFITSSSFPWPYVTKSFKTILVLRDFFYLTQFNRHKLWCSPKCRSSCLITCLYACFAICSN